MIPLEIWFYKKYHKNFQLQNRFNFDLRMVQHYVSCGNSKNITSYGQKSVNHTYFFNLVSPSIEVQINDIPGPGVGVNLVHNLSNNGKLGEFFCDLCNMRSMRQVIEFKLYKGRANDMKNMYKFVTWLTDFSVEINKKDSDFIFGFMKI